MANGKPSDPQEHELRSGALSGLKRGFAFVMKPPTVITYSRSRYRSCKSSVVAPAAPSAPAAPAAPPAPTALGGKSPKRSGNSVKQPLISPSPVGTVIIALPVVAAMDVDCSPLERVAAYVPAADRPNERYRKSSVDVSIRACNKEELEKDDISLDSQLLAEDNEGLEKDKVPVKKSITNCKELMSEVNPKNSTFIPLPDLPLGSTAMAPEVSSTLLEIDSASEQSVVLDGNNGSKVGNGFSEKPTRRFTRSALKIMPAISTPARIEKEQELVEVKKTRAFSRSAMKLMTPAAKGNLWKAISLAANLHTVNQENLVKIPNIANNCSGQDFENGQLDESIKAELQVHSSLTKISKFNKQSKKCNVVPLENPTMTPLTIRRCTRSSLKAAYKEFAVAVASIPTTVDSVESAESKGDDDSLNCSQSMMLKKKMELKMSKKIALTKTKLPSNVRELLSTGLLEGLPVRYISCLGKNVGLHGVIRGNGILCSCTSCQGQTVVPANQFEIHAGSTKKHPSDFIFLQNGKNLREVLNSCAGASMDMLEHIIQNIVGPLPPKQSSVCQRCKELFDTASTRNFPLVCISCLEPSHQQASPTSSHGMPSSAKRVLVPVISDGISMNLSSQKKPSFGKLTRKDLRLHKQIFMDDTLPQGTEVGYYLRGKRLLEGYIKDSGIFCRCCSSVLSPSQFEAHAGQAPRRKPYNNIYTSNGVSLHELSISLSKGRKLSATENDDLCGICADGGDLLLCDLCPRAFHKECLGLSSIPDGDWFCQYCQNMHKNDKCLSSNDNAIAAGRVAGVDPIEQIIKRCIRIVNAPENDAGVCALCSQHDFRRFGFDRRTVIICDQCEIEYHVGCLKDHGMEDLKELPQGEWFCCPECRSINSSLHKLLHVGPKALEEIDANIIRTKFDTKSLCKDALADIKWRLLSGKSGSADSKKLLSQAVSIFHESFDPIVDPISGRDLIPFMVYGRNMRDQDYGGLFCMVLTQNSSVVSAGLLRILGCEVAELPLVATRRESQGLGYFQSLFACMERLLKSFKVKNFVLPAADDAVSMWTNKFGFTKLTKTQLLQHVKSAQPIVFQGTSMLHKPVLSLLET